MPSTTVGRTLCIYRRLRGEWVLCNLSETPLMSSEKVPTVQSVWRVMRRGHPSKVLQLVHDAPVGADIKDNEVLVRVEAAALNPV